MHLDEFAEFLGDPMLVLLDDGGVRYRQSQRPPEQRNHCVPVREPADRRRLRERCEKSESRMHALHRLRDNEPNDAAKEDQRREHLDPAQFRRARDVAGIRDQHEFSVVSHTRIPQKWAPVLGSEYAPPY